MITKKFLDELSYEVIGAAIEVHRHLGPGLLESVYQQFLMVELAERDLFFDFEVPVTLEYKGKIVPTILRCDLVVEGCLPVELKAVEKLITVHDAQLYTYMKLLKAAKGVLLNFNSTNIFKNGQKTLVNEIYRNLK